MSSQPVVTVATSAARTATGNSGAFAVPPGSNALAALVNVTAASGTAPSCTFSVEWSNDGTTFAQADAADSFTALTSAATKVKRFDIKGGQFRLVWTISGTTPSFTFSATAYGI